MLFVEWSTNRCNTRRSLCDTVFLTGSHRCKQTVLEVCGLRRCCSNHVCCFCNICACSYVAPVIVMLAIYSVQIIYAPHNYIVYMRCSWISENQLNKNILHTWVKYVCRLEHLVLSDWCMHLSVMCVAYRACVEFFAHVETPTMWWADAPSTHAFRRATKCSII